MKKLVFLVLGFLLSTSASARVYDAFMCYTMFDTVVMFGVLKTPGTMRIHYHALKQNPQDIGMKVKVYDRGPSVIEAVGIHEGKEIISITSTQGVGSANIDLTSFEGTENVSFSYADTLCRFGKFEE